jgi:COMPASS component BRE2
VRFGWARREAPLDAPVGFDGYSYGVTDIRFETMHRSRPGKFFHPKKDKKAKSVKGAAAGPTTITLGPEDQHVKEGDVIGVEIQLPSLTLQQKIVSGVYNPAVDAGDGFDQTSAAVEAGTEPADIIRDRIPVPYKGNCYFEVLDHVASKPMEIYADRTTNLNNLPTSGAPQRDGIKAAPNPNHESPNLRTLPHSAMRVYKNGKLIGTAFENLLAFLPPASAPTKGGGAREGFDDGLVGYFPAISCFFGGIAEMNFGDAPNHGFWCPPPHLKSTKTSSSAAAAAAAKSAEQRTEESADVVMTGVTNGEGKTTMSSSSAGWNPGRQLRGIGERYKEQIAEDIVWDIIDEVDFFVQDGGFEGEVGSGNTGYGVSEKSSRLKSED